MSPGLFHGNNHRTRYSSTVLIILNTNKQKTTNKVNGSIKSCKNETLYRTIWPIGVSESWVCVTEVQNLNSKYLIHWNRLLYNKGVEVLPLLLLTQIKFPNNLYYLLKQVNFINLITIRVNIYDSSTIDNNILVKIL